MMWAEIHHDDHTAFGESLDRSIPRSTRMKILQHHVVPLINVTCGIF